MYIFEYEHWKRLKIIIFSPISGTSSTFSELAVIGALCRCAIAEKRICQHIFFFVIFLTP